MIMDSASSVTGLDFSTNNTVNSSSSGDQDQQGPNKIAAKWYTEDDMVQIIKKRTWHSDVEIKELLTERRNKMTLEDFGISLIGTKVIKGKMYYKLVIPQYVDIFSNNLNNGLMCRICSGYIIEAECMSVCKHIFCESCAKKFSYSSWKCPHCLYTGDADGEVQKRFTDELLTKLVYACFPGFQMLKPGFSEYDKPFLHVELVPAPELNDDHRARDIIVQISSSMLIQQLSNYMKVALQLGNEEVKILRHGEELAPFQTVKDIAPVPQERYGSMNLNYSF